jgi:hypothetical protein
MRLFQRRKVQTSEQYILEVEKYMAHIKKRRPVGSEGGTLTELFVLIGEDDLLGQMASPDRQSERA